MLRKRASRRQKPAQYQFYVWEGGTYAAADGGEFPSDREAIVEAQRQLQHGAIKRPLSLDAPHLHVIRQDGIHVMTLELPEQSEVNLLRKGDTQHRRLNSSG